MKELQELQLYVDYLIRRSENNVRLMGQMRTWESADPDAPSGTRDRPDLFRDEEA